MFGSRNSGLRRYWSLSVFAQIFSPRTHSCSVLLMNSESYLLPAVSRCASDYLQASSRLGACFESLLLALVHKNRVRRRNHCKVSQTCAGGVDRSRVMFVNRKA